MFEDGRRTIELIGSLPEVLRRGLVLCICHASFHTLPTLWQPPACFGLVGSCVVSRLFSVMWILQVYLKLHNTLCCPAGVYRLLLASACLSEVI